MRLANLTQSKIQVFLNGWRFGDGSQGHVHLVVPYEPGEWTDELDPEDPFVKRLLESGLTPQHLPTWFEVLLNEPPF